MNDKNIIKFSKCCANLYGVVSFTDIKNTINQYNHETVSEEVIEETLKKFISKRTIIQMKDKYIYKNKIFSESILDDFLDSLSNREFYYHETKFDFFFFESSTRADITYPASANLEKFLENHTKGKYHYEIAYELYEYIARTFMAGHSPTVILDTVFNDMKKDIKIEEHEFEEFLAILADAHNNTRMYNLRGFTPNENARGIKQKPYAY